VYAVRSSVGVEQTQTAPQQRSASLTYLAGAALLVGLVVFGWAAPDAYALYKMIHVLAALVWVGGGAMLVLLVLLTERENDPVALVNLGKKVELAGTRVFIPAGLVVLVFGILMMTKGDLAWSQFWVVAALVGFAITFAVGTFFLGPQTKKLNALLEEHGAEHRATQAKLQTILTVARFDVAMLLVVIRGQRHFSPRSWASVHVNRVKVS
jgi:uncharacterized membrane protein